MIESTAANGVGCCSVRLKPSAAAAAVGTPARQASRHQQHRDCVGGRVVVLAPPAQAAPPAHARHAHLRCHAVAARPSPRAPHAQHTLPCSRLHACSGAAAWTRTWASATAAAWPAAELHCLARRVHAPSSRLPPGKHHWPLAGSLARRISSTCMRVRHVHVSVQEATRGSHTHACRRAGTAATTAANAHLWHLAWLHQRLPEDHDAHAHARL